MSNPSQADQIRYVLRTELPFYCSTRPRLFSFLDDKYLSLLAPICVYWISASFFHLLDISGLKCIERYRIHESVADKSKNKVSLGNVIRCIILQQIIQTVLGVAVMYWDPVETPSLAKHAYDIQTLHQLTSTAIDRLGFQTNEARMYELATWMYWWAWPAVQMIMAL